MRQTGPTGSHFSEGCALALREIEARGEGALSRLEGELTGVRSGKPLARGVLTRLLRGERPMGMAMAAQLVPLLGVPFDAWSRPPPGRRRRGALQRAAA